MKGTDVALYLVKKFGLYEEPSAMEQLDSRLEALLLLWQGGLLEPQDAPELSAFLEKHHEGYFLLDDCRKDLLPARWPALSIVRRRLKMYGAPFDTFFLRRLPDRSIHPVSCVWCVDRTPPLPTSRAVCIDPEMQQVQPCAERDELGDLFLTGESVRTALARVAGNGALGGNPGRGPSVLDPGLYSLLMSLLEIGGLNRIYRDRKGSDEKKQLEWAATTIHRASIGLSLSDILIVDPASLLGFPERLFSAPLPKWPEGEIRIGYLLAVVSRIRFDGQVTVLEYERKKGSIYQVRIPFQVRVNARPADLEARAPYIVLLKAQMHPVRGPEWVDAYAHPIEKIFVWLPVDSALERAAAACIWRLAHNLIRRYPGFKFHFEKPVSDSRNYLGRFRPDFRIEVVLPDGDDDEFEILVEVMGSDDPLYLAQKVITHARMDHEGFLVLNDRARLSVFEADEELQRKIIEAIEEFLASIEWYTFDPDA